MTRGESLCVQRATHKYFAAMELVGKELQALGMQAQQPIPTATSQKQPQQ